MAQPFAGQENPFETPWTSLWLGRRGLEVSEAVHGAGVGDGEASDAERERHRLAVADFAEQWLDFLQSRFLPEFCERIDRIVFSGAIANRNFAEMSRVICPGGVLGGSKDGQQVHVRVERAPDGAALLGAAKYALGGGRGAADIWSQGGER